MKQILLTAFSVELNFNDKFKGYKTILELEDQDGKIYVCFFNVDKTKTGKFKLEKNSKLARLARISSGEMIESYQYTRAEFVTRKLLGLCFYPVGNLNKNFGRDKIIVNEILPLEIKHDERWIRNGKLKMPSKAYKTKLKDKKDVGHKNETIDLNDENSSSMNEVSSFNQEFDQYRNEIADSEIYRTQQQALDYLNGTSM